MEQAGAKAGISDPLILVEIVSDHKLSYDRFEAVAGTGVGVFDTLKAVAKLVLTELKKGGP